MENYPWLHYIYNKIIDTYCNNKGHHALLFTSMWDNGEKILINSIIHWLFCCNYQKKRVWCNICYSCCLMNAGTHPDFYQFNLNDNVQDTGIEIVRICINSIHQHARQGTTKIVYINNIEYLGNQAINSLLRVLENPPINTYFFLQTKNYLKIPLTLFSRCMHWNIISPKESIGLKWLIQELQEINDIVLKRCALRLCDGAPVSAKIILRSEDIWKKRLALCHSLGHAITNNNFLVVLPFLNVYKNYQFLYWLITLLVDALKWIRKTKEMFIINLDQKNLIAMISTRWDESSLNKQLQQWVILLHYFQDITNIDHKLLLTCRLLSWEKNIVESFFIDEV